MPIAAALRRTVCAALAAALLAGLTVVTGPWTARADAASYTATPLSRFDTRLLAKINRARVNHGLARLQLTAGTTDVAHTWSCHQARHRVLAHDPYLADRLVTHGSSLWTMYAENVGYVAVGTGARALFRAYMASPGHRANILDRSARFVGIWSKRGGGYRWNTIDFVGATSSAYQNSYGAPRVTC